MTRHKLLSLATLLIVLAGIGIAGGQDADREARIQRELAMQRPIDALDSVWIEELTWIEVRDAMAAGKKTAILTTGGIEQNGPYVATGKHNYELLGLCERIARALGERAVRADHQAGP